MSSPTSTLHAPSAQKTPYRVSSTTNFNLLRSYLLTTTDISQTPKSSPSTKQPTNGPTSRLANSVLPAPPPNTPMGSRSGTPATSPRRTGFGVPVEGERK